MAHVHPLHVWAGAQLVRKAIERIANDTVYASDTSLVQGVDHQFGNSV
jgi:hypothetical protein